MREIDVSDGGKVGQESQHHTRRGQAVPCRVSAGPSQETLHPGSQHRPFTLHWLFAELSQSPLEPHFPLVSEDLLISPLS